MTRDEAAAVAAELVSVPAELVRAAVNALTAPGPGPAARNLADELAALLPACRAAIIIDGVRVTCTESGGHVTPGECWWAWRAATEPTHRGELPNGVHFSWRIPEAGR